MVFISHDLSVVRYLCDRVMVMFAAKSSKRPDRASYSPRQHILIRARSYRGAAGRSVGGVGAGAARA